MGSGSANLNPCRLLDSRTLGIQRGRGGTGRRHGAAKNQPCSAKCISLPKGLQGLEVGWNAGNLDLARQPNTGVEKIHADKTEKWRGELGLIWVC